MHEEIKKGYLRVTTMLSPFSGMHTIPQHILDNACERGTYVHKKIEAYELGFSSEESNPDWEGYFQSYLKWATGKKFLPVPDRFYDDELMLTGEIDAMYQDGDSIVIADFKTPAKESKTWAIQATAYSYLAKKNGLNVTAVEFVKLEKDGTFPMVYTYRENMDLFSKILETYRYFFKQKDEDNLLDFL